MRKLITLPLLCVVLLFSCTSDKEDFSKLQNRNGIYFKPNEETPYSGDVSISDNNGTIILQGHLENGLKDEQWTTWYPNGQKESEGMYSGGFKDGTWKYWEENGVEKGVEIYKQGNKLGNEQEPGSNISAETDSVNSYKLDSDAKETNIQKEKTVTLRSLTGSYRKKLNGVPYTGPVVDYHSNGVVSLRGHFTNGLRSGKWTFYSTKGKVKSIKQY
ncbi:MAG: hypothetical protein HY738_15670 [Bacteroidia bacterium]|nr:hypothetical protein [Bacteroidia bacterium]